MATRKRTPSILKEIRVEEFRKNTAAVIAKMAFLPTHEERRKAVVELRLKFLEVSNTLLITNEAVSKYYLSSESMSNLGYLRALTKNCEEVSRLLELFGDILSAFEEASQSMQ